MTRKLQACAYELMPGDVVTGRGRVIEVTQGGGHNGGWRDVLFEGGQVDRCVSMNQVYDLDVSVPWDGVIR